jgi:hypothetical protein
MEAWRAVVAFLEDEPECTECGMPMYCLGCDDETVYSCPECLEPLICPQCDSPDEEEPDEEVKEASHAAAE